MKKITDPKKIVTDEHALRELKRLNINPDYVEFESDYNQKNKKGILNPFEKTYYDKRTKTGMSVFSSLPKSDMEGNRIEVGFSENGKDKYKSKPNLFSCEIDNTTVTIKKDSESVTYNPQLFINDKEMESGKPKLCNDILNENYSDNVIEWKYKGCTRRIRILEGRYREKWLFDSVDGKVEVKHNFKGDLKIDLGYGEDSNGEVKVEVIGDSEIFTGQAIDLVLGGTLTVTPSVDGTVNNTEMYVEWSALVNGAGTHSPGTSFASEVFFKIRNHTTTSPYFYSLTRSIYIFNTADTLGTTVLSASFSVRGSQKSDNEGILPDMCVYSASPVSTSSLAIEDYANVGDIAFSTPISYSDFSTTGYNDFALNSHGFDSIVNGSTTSLSLRNANYDVAEIAPPWAYTFESYLYGYYSEQGAGYEPKLVVVYKNKTEYIELNNVINKTININTPLNLE